MKIYLLYISMLFRIIRPLGCVSLTWNSFCIRAYVVGTGDKMTYGVKVSATETPLNGMDGRGLGFSGDSTDTIYTLYVPIDKSTLSQCW